MRVWRFLLVVPFLLAGCERKQVLPPLKAVAAREDGVIALRLVTFNLRYEGPEDVGQLNWHVRGMAAVRSLLRMSPDIFGIQEGLHGQVADLWASLPDYSFSGVGRDDGRKAGEYSGIFYRRDRFIPDLADAGSFWLSATPEAPGSMTWGNQFPRIVAWIHLTDRATGRGFYVYATHWDHRSSAAREKGALLMATRIDARRHPDEPVIILGDLNAQVDDSEVRYLRGKSALDKQGAWKSGLVDCLEALHPGEKDRTTLHLWNFKTKRVIDHVLVPKEARILSAEIVVDNEPYPSDHFPVSARIELPRK